MQDRQQVEKQNASGRNKQTSEMSEWRYQIPSLNTSSQDPKPTTLFKSPAPPDYYPSITTIHYPATSPNDLS
jgi:hypothetical protein